MVNKTTTIALLLLLIVCSSTVEAQKTFRYGLGGGINFANISEITSYPLFEDVSGEPYSSQYSSIFSNLGSQFFFHGEWELKQLIVAIKPGIYSYNFSKTDEVLFNSEPVEQSNSYLLRYFQIPLEARIVMGSGNFRPYIGGGIAYGHLLQIGGDGTNSFIHPKFTAAPLVGAYYSFTNFDLVLDLGYNIGLHSITRESSRVNTTSRTPYSQSDIKLNDLYASVSIIFALSQGGESKGALDCPAPSKTKQKKYKRK